MPLKPGNPVLAGDISETRPAASDDIEAGDAVALADGEMTHGEGGEADDVLGGIARHDGDNDGRGNANHLSGAIVANVEDGVSEGERLDLGGDGALTAAADGPAIALSDEGGTWHGVDDINAYDLPDGYAVVHL
jgi:hypothetical protein